LFEQHFQMIEVEQPLYWELHLSQMQDELQAEVQLKVEALVAAASHFLEYR